MRPASSGTLTDRYQRALRDLETNRLNETQTRAERDRLATEAQSLQTRLIANASKVQDLEAAYAATQNELARLGENERVLLADLDRDRDRVAHLLAVLQRLYADRPPALALRPDDSLAAARGTMQLGVMLPPVYEQVAALDRSLKALAATQLALRTKASDAQREAAQLTTLRAELDQLLQLRNRETVAADDEAVRSPNRHGNRRAPDPRSEGPDRPDRHAPRRQPTRSTRNDRGERPKFERRDARSGVRFGCPVVGTPSPATRQARAGRRVSMGLRAYGFRRRWRPRPWRRGIAKSCLRALTKNLGKS